MKKIIILAASICALSATAAFAAQVNITDNEKINQVISEYYPDLKDYYEAGVMSVESLKEETLADGSTEYDITYKFVKNYYDQDEIDDVLREQFPDVYGMSKIGLIKDISVYRFVNKATGTILTNVAYNSTRPQPDKAPRFHGPRFRHGRS